MITWIDRIGEWLTTLGGVRPLSYTKPEPSWPDPDRPNLPRPEGPLASWTERPFASWETMPLRKIRLSLARFDGSNDNLVAEIIQRRVRQEFGAASNKARDPRTLCPYRGVEAMDWLRGYDTGEVQGFWDVRDDIWRDMGVPEDRLAELRKGIR